MGKICMDSECPYLAKDGTCLLPGDELKEKCPARESVEREEKDEWIFKSFVKERLKSFGILQ